MTISELQLPDPAGRLWEEAGRKVMALVAKHTGEMPGYKLGGGTVLAARWRHRLSTDIDVKVERGTGLGGLHPRFKPEFSQDLGTIASGMTVIFEQDKVSVLFAGTPAANTPKIDVFEGPSVPSRGGGKYLIAGRREDVLSNAQILTGKILGRGLRSPVRDLYDIAVAARADRRALEIAINNTQKTSTVAAVEGWREARTKYLEDADARLEHVPPEYRSIKENITEEAENAVRGLWYKELRIEWSDRRTLTFTSTTEDGRRRKTRGEAETAEEIEEIYEKNGFKYWFENERRGISNDILRMIENGRMRAPVIVYEEGGPETHRSY